MSYDPTVPPGSTFGVTPTASPFTWQNVTGRSLMLVITGGVVTTISISRDGTVFIPVGILTGMFQMSSNDYIRIVYVTAPTLTAIPN